MKDYTREKRFAEVYNDRENYPSLEAVARALGRSVKTVKNYAGILRSRRKNDKKIPELQWRMPMLSEQDEKPRISPAGHAKVRAAALAGEMRTLLNISDYPVINPEAMVVQERIAFRYDRVLGRHVETEATPRTWLTDTLRVAPIKNPKGRRFLFSGAQNDAPVDMAFWANLNAYAKKIGAEIIVGPWTYETNWWDENNPASRDYDPVLQKHLCFGQMEIGGDFVFCGEMNTLPTASRPISDLTTYSCGRWAVFPHARLQLISVPSTDGSQAHQIMTTGAVTRPRVIPRKAGVKSIFHQVMGATLVEFDDDGDIFPRQINAADDGSFYDLDAFVSNGQITFGHRVKALTTGDVHAAKLDPINSLATFGFELNGNRRRKDNLLALLDPEYLLVHDVHDHENRNHHHERDVSHNFEMAIRGRESVMGEVQRSVDFLTSLDAPRTKITVIESNHDLALERYIREGRYRMDGVNFRTGLMLDAAYHDYRAEVAAALDSGKKPPKFSLLEWAIRYLGGKTVDHISWVYDGDSLILDGVQVGLHGFRGANGARGTVSGFSRLGEKMTIGDKHSPAILDGVYVAGVMQLDHGYNKGPSGWCVTHVIQYQNGKRSLVTLQNGKFRANRLSKRSSSCKMSK